MLCILWTEGIVRELETQIFWWLGRHSYMVYRCFGYMYMKSSSTTLCDIIQTVIRCQTVETGSEKWMAVFCLNSNEKKNHSCYFYLLLVLHSANDGNCLWYHCLIWIMCVEVDRWHKCFLSWMRLRQKVKRVKHGSRHLIKKYQTKNSRESIPAWWDSFYFECRKSPLRSWQCKSLRYHFASVLLHA